MNRKFRSARLWSNQELRKFAHLFTGSVANVSGWTDEDKEGSFYMNYFSRCNDYVITNYKSEARGFQGLENEIFLDLTKVLPAKLRERFDVVFNHTVLEHVYEVHTAVENLCQMSKDVVIVVVPFLQPMHADYGDYWRFTPLTLHQLFRAHEFTTIYCSFNNDIDTSVYIFYVAARHPNKWGHISGGLLADGTPDCYAKPFLNDGFERMLGTNSIIDPFFRILRLFRIGLEKARKITHFFIPVGAARKTERVKKNL